MAVPRPFSKLSLTTEREGAPLRIFIPNAAFFRMHANVSIAPFVKNRTFDARMTYYNGELEFTPYIIIW